MEYKINEISLSEKEIEVTLPFEEIKNDVEVEVKKQTKSIQIAGFRKGKVPLQLIKKMYGDALEHEASEKIANNHFWELAKEKHLHPIGQPTMTDIKFEPGQELFFKVKYEVVPKLDVKDYIDIAIEVPKFEVTDEEVNSEVKYILKANSSSTDVEVVGDDRNFILDLDINRVDDKGEIMEGTVSQKLKVDMTNDGVQKEILENSKGKKVGEYFTFSFTDERTEKDEKDEDKNISENFSYKALIKGIKKIQMPELNEELIKKVTKDKVNNEADLRTEIRKDIQEYYDQKTEDIIHDKITNAIIQNNDFTPPAALVNNVLADLIKAEEEAVKKRGYGKHDKTESLKRLSKVAEYNVKWYLIKDAIQKKENITLSEDEVHNLAAQDAEKTGIAVDKLVNYYKSSSYGDKIIDKKLFEFLKEKTTINFIEPNNYSQIEKKDES